MDYNKLASQESLTKTIASLVSNGITAITVKNSDEALQKIQELIPLGSHVMTMTSVTLDQTGIAKEINETGKFVSAKNELWSMNRETQNMEMQRLGSAPEYTLGSVHAVTENGQIIVASNTGSQLPAYAYGSPHVILIVGTNKIVPDLDLAFKRVNEFVLPLESERAKKAYGVPGSNVSKLLIINKETNPTRLTVIFVPEILGF